MAATTAREHSDATLIARSLTEPAAFGRIFDRHWLAIHRFCTSRAGPAGENIAAEVFRAAFDRRAIPSEPRSHAPARRHRAAPRGHPVIDHDDIGWLAELQPGHDEPAVLETARARRALLAHIELLRELDQRRRLRRGDGEGRAPRAVVERHARRDRGDGACGDEPATAVRRPSPSGSETGAGVVEAAAKAVSQPPAEARAAFVAASFPPGTDLEEMVGTETPAGVSAAMRERIAALREEAGGAAAEKIAAMEKVTENPRPPRTRSQREDEVIWGSGMNALLAGAGRTDVRAGVFALLATVPSVHVDEKAVAGGRKLLALKATYFSDGYVEELDVDAETGVPLQFIGGNPGEEPGVIVDYTVTRETAATYARGGNG